MREKIINEGYSLKERNPDDWQVWSNRGQWLKPYISERGYYVVNLGRGNQKKLHRIIGALVCGISDSKEVDHIDRNPLNNRPDNLRAASRWEQMRNRGPNKGRKFRGVSWDKGKGKWVAQLTSSGRKLLSKRFNSELEAAERWNEVARKTWGEYAFQNKL